MIRVTLIILIVGSLSSLLLAQDSVIKPPEDCIGCPKIIIHGKLARILKVSWCEGISGLTCRIQFAESAVLPSRIIVQQLDRSQNSLGKKFLPYPNLKPGEKGRASFPAGSANTLVLVGDFKGAWRSAY